jgi:hypothetical protein
MCELHVSARARLIYGSRRAADHSKRERRLVVVLHLARQFCDSGASLAYSYTYDGYDTLGDGDGDGKDSIQWMLESSLATLNPSRPGGVKAKFFTGDDENNTRPAFYLSLFNVSHGVTVAWKLRDDAVYLLDTKVRERGRRHLARDEHVFLCIEAHIT